MVDGLRRSFAPGKLLGDFDNSLKSPRKASATSMTPFGYDEKVAEPIGTVTFEANAVIAVRRRAPILHH
jgi:hypothetical protein